MSADLERGHIACKYAEEQGDKQNAGGAKRDALDVDAADKIAERSDDRDKKDDGKCDESTSPKYDIKTSVPNDVRIICEASCLMSQSFLERST